MSCVLSSSATSHTAYFGTVEVQGAVLPIMAYTRGSAWKGYLFQASGIWKGTDFTRWSIWKGRGICHLGLWKGLKGWTDEFYGVIKSGKHSIFVIDSYLNDSAFTAVKRDEKFLTRYVKGASLVNRKYTKGVPFSWKTVYKRVRGWTSGLNLPV